MELSKEIIERLEKLQEKYSAMGQDLVSYLDGLLYADYLTYWDYIHLDTLLSLQTPRTPFPDEKVFIIYHQITELYFKLILSECAQIAEKEKPEEAFFIERMQRVNRYFNNLTHSFLIMVDGMDKEQFLKYRMSLLPASGFQSAQYRSIEICATDFINLVDKDVREQLRNNPIEVLFDHIYWKKGATELATGKKTLTLKQFEEKYSEELTAFARKYKDINLWRKFKELNSDNPELKTQLRLFDTHVNVNWPLAHYKSAVRYLQKDPEDIKATGGTNWQKYLPPRFQKRIFYPELWSAQEIEDWGKSWVEDALQVKH